MEGEKKREIKDGIKEPTLCVCVCGFSDERMKLPFTEQGKRGRRVCGGRSRTVALCVIRSEMLAGHPTGWTAGRQGEGQAGHRDLGVTRLGVAFSATRLNEIT